MLETFHFKLSSASVVKWSEIFRLAMAEGDFWNNLDSFVEQKSSGGGESSKGGSEKVGDWLNSIPDPSKTDSEKKKKKKAPPSTQTTPSKTK